MNREQPKVICIGGAPMVGKSTVARMIAARLQYGLISTDDLCEAISAVTDETSHPAFHYMNGLDYRDYYITRSEEELQQDTNRQHEALWPALKKLCENHADWGTPVIVEGWALRPSRIAELTGSVDSVFLLADDELIESRAREDTFSQGTFDEELMIQNYAKRSIWFNALIRKEASDLEVKTISVTERMTIDYITDRCMNALQVSGMQ